MGDLRVLTDLEFNIIICFTVGIDDIVLTKTHHEHRTTRRAVRGSLPLILSIEHFICIGAPIADFLFSGYT